MKTTLEIYCSTVGWRGGTIHQAKEHFAVINLQAQDKICGALLSNMSDISDLETVQYFTSKRIENIEFINLSNRR